LGLGLRVRVRVRAGVRARVRVLAHRPTQPLGRPTAVGHDLGRMAELEEQRERRGQRRHTAVLRRAAGRRADGRGGCSAVEHIGVALLRGD